MWNPNAHYTKHLEQGKQNEHREKAAKGLIERQAAAVRRTHKAHCYWFERDEKHQLRFNITAWHLVHAAHEFKRMHSRNIRMLI